MRNTLNLTVQYMQIYLGIITDLISSGHAQLCNGMHLVSAGSMPLLSLNNAWCILRATKVHKRWAAMAMKAHLLHTHTVFLITLMQMSCHRQYES
jgi:hypothetical protein